MSNDDRFISRLKALESAPPAPTIDPHTVLKAGRRRRVARGSGITALTLVAVTGLFTGVTALPNPFGPADPAAVPTPTPSVTIPAPHASIDPRTGRVTLPLAEYSASAYDVTVMMAAHDVAVSKCMADAGFADAYRFTAPDSPDTRYQTYGLTTRAQLERDGYTQPATSPTHGTSTDLDIPGARDALATCLPKVLAMGFSYEPGDENGLGQPAYAPTAAKDTTEGRALIAELSGCLRSHGAPPVEVDSDGLMPKGVLELDRDEQVRIGLIDLECRRSIDFLQRFADIDAQQQQTYIDDNRTYFDAYKKVHDAAMSASYVYLDDAGIVMDR